MDIKQQQYYYYYAYGVNGSGIWTEPREDVLSLLHNVWSLCWEDLNG